MSIYIAHRRKKTSNGVLQIVTLACGDHLGYIVDQWGLYSATKMFSLQTETARNVA